MMIAGIQRRLWAEQRPAITSRSFVGGTSRLSVRLQRRSQRRESCLAVMPMDLVDAAGECVSDGGGVPWRLEVCTQAWSLRLRSDSERNLQF